MQRKKYDNNNEDYNNSNNNDNNNNNYDNYNDDDDKNNYNNKNINRDNNTAPFPAKQWTNIPLTNFSSKKAKKNYSIQLNYMMCRGNFWTWKLDFKWDLDLQKFQALGKPKY